MDGNHQDDIVNIMQNDITTMLFQQTLCFGLPPRNIPVFDADPLQYKSFIRAFENGVEQKTTSWKDFLEQYTRGQPRDLVLSCQHLPAEQGYLKAKDLLAEHFGNEHKIASAYMNKIHSWTPVKSEDVKALLSFSLFLRGCANLTSQIMYMKELDLPSNMSVVLKLPYKLREKWRSVACDLHEQKGQRALFTDLVAFIEKQAKIASDPVFGIILDSQPINSTKASNPAKPRKKGSSFATNVTPVQDGAVVQQQMKEKGKFSSPVKFLFCAQTNHLLERCLQFKGTLHRDKINFIKEHGICFGCLKVGHIDCRNRLDCKLCQQRHPGVLHIEHQDKGTSLEQAQNSVKHPFRVSTTTQT